MLTHPTLKAFDAELDALKRLVGAMGALAANQLRAAIAALANDRQEDATRIVRQDKSIDEMQRQIEVQAVCFIAERHPQAIDLREALSAIRLAINIERIGDLGTNIAKRTIDLHAASNFAETLADMPALGELSLRLLASSMDAIARRDSQSLLAVWRDRMGTPNPYNAAIDTLANAMLARPASMSTGAHLLFCIRNIEHVEGHALEVAKIVYAAIEGRPLPTVTDSIESFDNPVAPLVPLTFAVPFLSHLAVQSRRDMHGIK